MSSETNMDAGAGPSLSQQAMVQAGHMHRAQYMEGLNTPQREAVEALDGPVLMLAGAGQASVIAPSHARPAGSRP